MFNRNNKKKKHTNSHIENNNIFEWLSAQFYSLNPQQDKNVIDGEEQMFDFNIIGIEGGIFSRRKLWFFLCILPSNYIKCNQLSILCWSSSTILG